jgi:hypothetical protein
LVLAKWACFLYESEEVFYLNTKGGRVV